MRKAGKLATSPGRLGCDVTISDCIPRPINVLPLSATYPQLASSKRPIMSGAGDQHREMPGQLRDHYIPLRPVDLVRKLGDEPAVTIFEREQFRQFCQLVAATIHHEYHARLEELKVAYAPFDPDDDAAIQFDLSDAERAARCRDLFADFGALLNRANYRKLSREEIEEAVRSPSAGGLRLKLDLELFQRLEVYVRGPCELIRKSRSWHTRWRERTISVAGYRRLALIFRLRERSPLTDPLDTRAVVLKLFKDIPQEDIETLLPGANVQIGLFEQAQIVVPTLSGIGLTLFKLLKGAAAVAFAGVYGLIAFLGLISGAIGYGVKSFFGYLRTREKHQLCLTRHLYFQNLDNNAGVIYHLLAEAEEQEFREIALAWWLLWRGGLAGATRQQLDEAAESWLRERCGIEADFEVADALAKLKRLGLANESSPDRWRAVTMEEALESLDRAWDEQFDYHRPKQSDEAGLRPRIWRRAA
jgi:Protein of unknown function (DUF3754)